MSAHGALQTGIGKAFDVLAAQFMPAQVVTLVKPKGTTREYETVLLIDSKRFFEYAKTRNDVILEVTGDFPGITAAMADATHLKIDSDVYTIMPSDPLEPKSTDVTWKIYASLDPEKSQFRTLF